MSSAAIHNLPVLKVDFALRGGALRWLAITTYALQNKLGGGTQIVPASAHCQSDL